MSDTPETDAHEDAFKGFLSGRYPKEAEAWPAFARSLERRLREALDMCDSYAEQLSAAVRDAQRYRAKRDMDHADWLERVASVGGGPNQSKDEYCAGYDAEMDDYAALAEKGKP